MRVYLKIDLVYLYSAPTSRSGQKSVLIRSFVFLFVAVLSLSLFEEISDAVATLRSNDVSGENGQGLLISVVAGELGTPVPLEKDQAQPSTITKETAHSVGGPADDETRPNIRKQNPLPPVLLPPALSNSTDAVNMK